MKKMNNSGFVLLETIIVAVFIISIFTFVYASVVPLLGKYDDLTHDYDIDSAYKLYSIRDMIYKDENFSSIVKNDYKMLNRDDFQEKGYYDSLMSFLFNNNNYKVVYIRKLESRSSQLISNLSITGGFKDYIEKIARTKASAENENFIFLEDNKNYSYLGLGVSLSDVTNFKEPVTIDFNNHVDSSGANKPLIMDGMIPIYYDDSTNVWHKADASNKSLIHTWYDYNKFQWANVAMVSSSSRNKYKNAVVGTEISIDDIVAFYVWIPRYEYHITGQYGAGGTQDLPGPIEVSFIPNSIEKQRKIDGYTWRTPTAFTFGSEELNGFWFAKFEMSNSDNMAFSYNGESVPFILPDVYVWSDQKIAQAYNKITKYMNGSIGGEIYGLTSSKYTSDAHVMKNDEWGAVAYLSQSKYGKYGNGAFLGANKEIYINNRSIPGYLIVISGSSGGHPKTNDIINRDCATTSADTSIGCYHYYVDGMGTGASTTGTIYGIYDMSGGTNEIVMGAMGNNACSVYQPYIGATKEFTGFNGPLSDNQSTCIKNNDNTDFPTDEKYFRIYGSSIDKGCGPNGIATGIATNDICYSHAMSETSGWYRNISKAVTQLKPWYVRGGLIAASSGIFAITNYTGETITGNVDTGVTTRPIIAVY